MDSKVYESLTMKEITINETFTADSRSPNANNNQKQFNFNHVNRMKKLS
jgi:hypothetical protein